MQREISKDERTRVILNIFDVITTEWKGAEMTFTLYGFDNIVIKGSDIVQLITKAVDKSIRYESTTQRHETPGDYSGHQFMEKIHKTMPR